MSLFNAKFEVARENISIWSGALTSLIQKKEMSEKNNLDEIVTFKTELKLIEQEYLNIAPDNEDLINKAIYIYGRLIRDFMEHDA